MAQGRQQAGQQAGSAEAEGARGDPLLAQDLFGHGQVLTGNGCVFHATSRLEAHLRVLGLDHFHHDAGRFRGRIDRHLAGGGLDEVGTGVDGDLGGATDQRLFLQLAGLDDHFQQRLVATGFLTSFDQIEADLFIAGHEGAVREHHVHFIGTVGDGSTSLGHGDLDVVVAVREVGHGGDAHVGGTDLTQGLASNGDETGVDADGGGEAGR
ncbi:hypothetical protein D3C79_601660 [compost metagenome]